MGLGGGESSDAVCQYRPATCTFPRAPQRAKGPSRFPSLAGMRYHGSQSSPFEDRKAATHSRQALHMCFLPVPARQPRGSRRPPSPPAAHSPTRAHVGVVWPEPAGCAHIKGQLLAAFGEFTARNQTLFPAGSAALSTSCRRGSPDPELEATRLSTSNISEEVNTRKRHAQKVGPCSH